jgi:23S rRNA (pseudouridine1915-N3)-methyltransferase
MKLHIITIGEPKLAYAKAGWAEYIGRLQHYHAVRVTHIPDKWAYDGAYVRQTAGNAYKVALVLGGKQYTSPELAAFLEKRALDAPEGLPKEIITGADFTWGLSPLTFPHDLAMVVLAEALYRASTISAGQPYHK